MVRGTQREGLDVTLRRMIAHLQVGRLKYAVTLTVLPSVLLFSLAHITLPEQLASAADTSSTSANLTSAPKTNLNANNSEINTFHAKGQIGGLITGLIGGGMTNNTNATARSPEIYIVSGFWNLDVVGGKVQNWSASFGMVLQNGTNAHTHTITNITNVTAGAKPSNITTIQMNAADHGLSFSGLADIYTNGTATWKAVPLAVTIYNGSTININADPAKDNDHLKGMPILGIVTSLTDQNGKRLEPAIFTLSGQR